MPATNPGTTNLVAWWAMDSGALGTDSHGSSTLTNDNVAEGAALVGSASGDFEAGSTARLYCADNAAVSMGDIDFTICGWANFESLSGNMYLGGKFGGTANEYYWLYDNGGARFRFNCTGSFGTTHNHSYTPSTSTWYFVAWWHDATANQIGSSINAGTPQTTAHTGGCNDSNSAFMLGTLNDLAGTYFDGLMDEVCIYKRKLSADELTWLYNSGSGRSYADLTASAGNPLGLFAAQQRAMYAYGGVSVG